MKKLFINLSNHPSAKWSAKQIDAAKEVADEVVDFAFPNVDPYANEGKIEIMAMDLLTDVEDLCNIVGASFSHATICIAGEFSLVIQFIKLCENLRVGFDVVVATSERNTVINKDGSKTVRFDFVQFRRVY